MCTGVFFLLVFCSTLHCDRFGCKGEFVSLSVVVGCKSTFPGKLSQRSPLVSNSEQSQHTPEYAVRERKTTQLAAWECRALTTELKVWAAA